MEKEESRINREKCRSGDKQGGEKNVVSVGIKGDSDKKNA